MNRTHRDQIFRALRQPAPMFGALVIVVFWISLNYQLSLDRERATEAAVQNGHRLTRLISDHITQLVGTVDRTLLLLRHAYEESPGQFDLNQWAERAALINGVTTEIGMLDTNLYLRARTGYSGPPIYLGDRDDVQASAQGAGDELFITKPIVLRTTGKKAIQLSRKLRNPDGSFAGTVSIQIDPRQIESFYETLGLAPNDSVILRGLDGVIRASSGLSTEASTEEGMPRNIGRALAGAPMGYFWGQGNVDNIARLVFYRVIDGFPLLISYGKTFPSLLVDYERQRLVYIVVGLVLTLLVLLAVAFSIQRQLSLELANVRFDCAIENMLQGLCMFDANGRLLVSNRRYGEMYQLPPELLQMGTPFRRSSDFGPSRAFCRTTQLQ
jgi:PAS domain-containing protein